MKLFCLTMSLLFVISNQASADTTITFAPDEILGVSRLHDAGDSGFGLIDRSIPKKTVFYRSGQLKVSFPLSDNEMIVQLSADDSKDAARSMGHLFSNFTVVSDMTSFPCTGSDAVGSSGLPATNYYVFVKSSSLGKEVTLASGEVVKQVSFPSFCLSEQNKAKFEHFFFAMGFWV